MRKYILMLLITVLILLSITSCGEAEALPDGVTDASEHGITPDNSAQENTQNLQRLIDTLYQSGGTVYIPRGEYKFAAGGTQTIGSHCIKMRSGVSIIGEGELTVLKPVGESSYGLDMFYFNEYLDTGVPVYLENCNFESFVIDGEKTSSESYTSAGKGFMFNLFKNCHFKGVTVKNTDATGFGVDCPINCTIKDCVAIGCGKGAEGDSSGASGFGIGFGYADGESITISDCTANKNKKFGFFFEHQGRFDKKKYSAWSNHRFAVNDSSATGNLYNFGGIETTNTQYSGCISKDSLSHGFYFENSRLSGATNCESNGDTNSSFAISASGEHRIGSIEFSDCKGSNSLHGVTVSVTDAASISDAVINSCEFDGISLYTVYTSGKIEVLTLTNNVSDNEKLLFDGEIVAFENKGNSWCKDTK